MKLRNHLMLWLAFTSLLPLLVLLFAAIRYSQQLYEESVDQEMLAELNSLTGSIEEQLYRQRNLVDALADSPILLAFGKAFDDVINSGDLTIQYSQTKYHLENFLSDLQPLVAEDAVIRVLDNEANTLIKVSFGSTARPSLESLLPYRISEAEADSRLAKQLEQLPDDSISYLRFPGSLEDFYPRQKLALMDAVRPVRMNNIRLYIVFSSLGGKLDFLLELAPRPRQAQLMIAAGEIQNSQALRLLYSDTHNLQFSSTHNTHAADTPLLLKQNWHSQHEGVLDDVDMTRYYYTEYQPYPDQLISWVIAAGIDRSTLSEQFHIIRLGIVMLALLALAFSFFLSRYASLRLAKPITRLAQNMHAYAQGEPTRKNIPTLSSEITALQQAFEIMTASLEKSEKQKARAEQQLLHSAKLASIGEMAAGIGHELNNPLNNILSLTKLIKRDIDPDSPLHEDILSLQEEAQRASRIIQGILNFARQIQPDYQYIKLSSCLNRCLKRVQQQAREKTLSFELSCKSGLKLEADELQLEQVVLNLLQNAIFASPKNGRILISAVQKNSLVELQIIDQGKGLAAEAKAHLFEPFFSTKPIGQGSGLGLAVSLGIVESHGGTLSLENGRSGGCIATIRIPARQPSGGSAKSNNKPVDEPINS